MKITEVGNKYLVQLGKRQLMLEEVKNEKGIKLFTIYEVKTYKTGEKEWSPDTAQAKKLTYKDAPDDIKKILRTFKLKI
ncbi:MULTISPECIES: hypothetical protein [Acidianus]|uniref:Uncharacterized protein n=1 Tax=Candidatus Acidianus copahuensis TaxID=1160895 RepID=A0A031LRP1_9CREN|nr:MULTISPECIES: hypothetical protein [Acidianus]EZQ11037.1 hypothetical protein CM19_02185 [Candidatus Acidianus copahuensis]NON62886.1 hypothetical protein [Acidianus sp. RZ1]